LPAGVRERAVGNADMLAGLTANPDTIGYDSFNFEYLSGIAANPSFGYLMIDGIDPLFADYENLAANLGQPALPGVPLSWGELPVCTPGGVPDCRANAIWAGGVSYPHLRNGTYPPWSELHLMCNAANAHCTVAVDANGAEALMQHVQSDIHNNVFGATPDFLPFDDAKAWTVNGYGDAGFIRDHYSFVQASDHDEFANIPPYSNATPGTTRQTVTVVNFGGAGPFCPALNVPVDAPVRSAAAMWAAGS
jgi:hypothetical protein